MSIQEAIGVLQELMGQRGVVYGKSRQQVEEALTRAVRALQDQSPREPVVGKGQELLCPQCGKWEYLRNEDGEENLYCGYCGQAIGWWW